MKDQNKDSNAAVEIKLYKYDEKSRWKCVIAEDLEGEVMSLTADMCREDRGRDEGCEVRI